MHLNRIELAVRKQCVSLECRTIRIVYVVEIVCTKVFGIDLEKIKLFYSVSILKSLSIISVLY